MKHSLWLIDRFPLASMVPVDLAMQGSLVALCPSASLMEKEQMPQYSILCTKPDGGKFVVGPFNSHADAARYHFLMPLKELDLPNAEIIKSYVPNPSDY